MRPKEEIGMKGPQRAFKGTIWYGMGSSSDSNFSAVKTARKRPYRSIRFGATKVEWLVCKKMVDLKENHMIQTYFHQDILTLVKV